MRPFSVIGEKQQAEGIKVKTPNRINSVVNIFKKVGYQGSPLGIFKRADVTERFIEDQVKPLRWGRDFLAIHENDV